MDRMNIHKSAEDYLEMILMLREKKGYARSVDISLSLGVTKPSVSFAMKKLRENGYILVDEHNEITLTDKGMEILKNEVARLRELADNGEAILGKENGDGDQNRT